MPESRLEVVDARMLPQEVRDALAPGEARLDEHGSLRELPRFFYRIESWDHAMSVRLTPNFGLWEFIQTDVRENPILQSFPRYIPCALPMLALALDRFRERVDTFVHVAANGGYRSPTHARNRERASTHCWGTAVDIYKIGDTSLDSRGAIQEYSAIARDTIPGAWARPYGADRGEADDHLHLDLGFVLAVPRDAHPTSITEVTP
jgi:hypothetical protein